MVLPAEIPARVAIGTILMWKGIEKELSGGFKRTTNNRMELMAVIAGLEALRKMVLRLKIYSDSQYVVNAVEKGWLKNWIATDFKGGKKNKDLWLTIFGACSQTSYSISMGKRTCFQSA